MKKMPSSEYRKILEAMPICCVDILIREGDKILLVKRRDNPAKEEFWPPGGRIYKNETLKEAVKRKALEETGLKVKIEGQVGVYETFFENGIFDNLKGGTHTINVCYLTKVIGDSSKIVLDKTGSEFKWVHITEEDIPDYVKRYFKDLRFFKNIVA